MNYNSILKYIFYRVFRYEDIFSQMDGVKSVYDFLGLQNVSSNSNSCQSPKNQDWIYNMTLNEIISIQNAVSSN